MLLSPIVQGAGQQSDVRYRGSVPVTVETADPGSLESKLQDYESQGMWSHAAELADKSGLQERALDDYKKAGYNF